MSKPVVTEVIRPLDLTIGRLDRLLSEFLLAAEDPNLDEADRQTIKHHADDLIGVGNAALKKIENTRDGWRSLLPEVPEVSPVTGERCVLDRKILEYLDKAPGDATLETIRTAVMARFDTVRRRVRALTNDGSVVRNTRGPRATYQRGPTK